MSRCPATTTRSARPRSVRATTVLPCRETVRCSSGRSAASTSSAIRFSLWLTDSMFTSCSSRVTGSAERSRGMPLILSGDVRFPDADHDETSYAPPAREETHAHHDRRALAGPDPVTSVPCVASGGRARLPRSRSACSVGRARSRPGSVWWLGLLAAGEVLLEVPSLAAAWGLGRCSSRLSVPGGGQRACGWTRSSTRSAGSPGRPCRTAWRWPAGSARSPSGCSRRTP